MSLSQIRQLFAQFDFDGANFQKLSLKYQPKMAHQLFSSIQHKPGAILLSSAGAEHPDSRFDIIVTGPLATFTSSNGHSNYRVDGDTLPLSDSPFTCLKEIEHLLPNWRELEPDLPFCGGLMGLWGYDLGKQIEQIPINAHADLTVPDMSVGLYSWSIVIDHQNQQAFAVGINAKQQYQDLLLSISDNDSTNKVPFNLTGDWVSNMSKASYVEKFNRVKEYIYAGDCYQINLAQRFQADYQGSEWLAYQALEESNKGPFSAFIRLEHGAILSVSPERFIRLDDRKMQTKPIKGTRPREQDPIKDQAQKKSLVTAEKDQAENLMIVDLLRNDFGRVATPGSVHVPKLFDVESFPAVHHLVSTVEAELEPNKTASELLEACFPGGSITGAPKVRAMQIIEELEPHARNAYCGSIGYISNNKKMDTSITIRTLVAQNNTLYAWAGGGLVVDSQADEEYQETLDKLGKILPVLS